MGLFCTAFAFLTQTVAQKHLDSAKVAIILATEPVFASIVAYFLLGEKLSVYGMFGGLLIIISLIVSELDLGKFNKKE